MKFNLKNPDAQKPASIQAGDIAALARQGLERALAARESMTELSAEQAGDVGGGLYLSPSIYGGILASRYLGGTYTVPSAQTTLG